MPTKTTWAAAALLACGVIHAGCSDSSRSRGGATAAAAATSGSTTTNTTGAATPASTPAIPAAPASQGQPLTVLNAEIQRLWDEVRPAALNQLTTLLSTQLQNARYANSTVSVELRNARVGAATDLTTAPGLVRLDTQQIELRAPITGDWTLAIDADIRVQLSVGGFSPAIDLPITLRLEDLSVQVLASLDDRDPTRPVLTRVGQPQVNFTLHLDSTNGLVQQLTGVLTQPANWIAQQAITIALASVMPQLGNVQGIPGGIPGDGAAPLVDSGAATPFQEVADNVSFKIRQHHTPHGPILSAFVDQPATDTWLAAYRNGGPGLQGQVVRYEIGGDAPIWTATTLAAEAYRYHVTGSTLALDNIGHLLGGIGKLLDVNGGTGLLARIAAPEASPHGQQLVATGRVFRRAQINGATWVGFQGNGISRDQYNGLFFGLAITWEYVPAARPECELRIKQMLDYLIRNDWNVDEDRPAFNPSGPTGNASFPTSWTGINYQKLAFLLIGHRVDPARYANALAQAGPLSETAWLGMWSSTLSLDSYYKFNLSHIGLFNYFRLETDPTRWQDLRRAYAILERYTGHHRNAHFDLIQTSIDPSTRAVLYPSIRQSLREFVEQSKHRYVADAVIDLSGVQFVNVPTFALQASAGGFALNATTASFPSEPLRHGLRPPAGHFVWQRNPFDPATPSQGDPRLEKPGLDLLLPYWMGRALGAF